MTNKIIFNVTRVDQTNLVNCLKPSLSAFYLNKELSLLNLVRKYSDSLGEKEILFCTLETEKELIASCMLIRSNLNLNGLNIPIFFLTQVVTEEKFRRMGYFGLLLQKVEALTRQKKVDILIVIARRAVTDLYWKFNFKGFSHFPEYNLKSTVELPSINSFRTANLEDLEMLRDAHSRSINNSNCRIIRSKLFWQSIIKNQSEVTCEVLIPIDKRNRNYVILQNGALVEASSGGDHQNSDTFFVETESLLKPIKLDRSHPISSCLLSDKWQYKERFEPKEGHLYKLLGTLPKVAKIFFEEITNEFGNERLEISPLDQW